MPGIGEFTHRVFSDPPVFNGARMAAIPQGMEKHPSRGANLLEAMDGAVTVQLDFAGAGLPDTADHYEFTFPLTARDEDFWWLFERARKRGVPVYFVPWDREIEPFTAGLTTTSFTLPRPTAESVLAIASYPEVGEYETYAYLTDTNGENEAAQTVITSGTPGSGQVKIVGREITTPALSVGQLLTIDYCPAYAVVVASQPERLGEARQLSKQVTLVESRTSI